MALIRDLPSTDRPPSEEQRASLRPAARLARWSPLAVAALALCVFAIRINGAGAWWDEGVTRDIVTRPVAEMWEVTSRIDLVHRLYYLLGHGLWLLLGQPQSSETVLVGLRALSAVAMAATCGLVVLLGSRVASRSAGVVAGLLMISAPYASWYAQEARSPAIVGLIVTGSTVVLVGLVRPGDAAVDEGRWRRRGRWFLYGALVLLAALTHMLAVLILAAHAVVVLAWGSARTRRSWLITAAAVSLLLVPFMLAASRQVGQVVWIERPSVRNGLEVISFQWPVAVLVVAAIGTACLLWARRRFWARESQLRIHEDALFLGLAWCAVPPATLWLISQVHPLFDHRYVLYTMPGVALAMASLTPLWRGVPVVLLIIALAVDGLPDQSFRRSELGHGEALRPVAQYIEEYSATGDAVLFDGLRHVVVQMAYPEDFAGTVDVAADTDPALPPTLYRFETTDPAVLADRLDAHRRVWLITGTGHPTDRRPEDAIKSRLLRQSFVEMRHRSFSDYEVGLYVPKLSVSSGG